MGRTHPGFAGSPLLVRVLLLLLNLQRLEGGQPTPQGRQRPSRAFSIKRGGGDLLERQELIGELMALIITAGCEVKALKG